MKTFKTTSMLVCLATLVAAGCGAGGEGDETPDTTPGRVTPTSQADCEEGTWFSAGPSECVSCEGVVLSCQDLDFERSRFELTLNEDGDAIAFDVELALADGAPPLVRASLEYTEAQELSSDITPGGGGGGSFIDAEELSVTVETEPARVASFSGVVTEVPVGSVFVRSVDLETVCPGSSTLAIQGRRNSDSDFPEPEAPLGCAPQN